MKLKYNEIVSRNYSNGVHIQYDEIGNNNIYIILVKSDFKVQGNGTISLTAFLEDFKDKNIYLFATSELGTDIKVLNHWYEKLGFIKSRNVSYVPYNVSHVKQIKI